VTGGFRAFWLLINIYHIIESAEMVHCDNPHRVAGFVLVKFTGPGFVSSPNMQALKLLLGFVMQDSDNDLHQLELQFG